MSHREATASQWAVKKTSTSLPHDCRLFDFEGCVCSPLVSVCRQSLIPDRQLRSRIQAVNTESIAYCVARCVLRWSIVILRSKSPYVHMSEQVGSTYKPGLIEHQQHMPAFFFIHKHAVLFRCVYHCVTECFMSDSLDRPGYNEIPGAECSLPVKQQM